MHVEVDLHALLMKNFEHRVLRIEPILLYKGVQIIRVLNLHRDKKIVGENLGEMGRSIMTQDAAHKGFCCTIPLYIVSR